MVGAASVSRDGPNKSHSTEATARNRPEEKFLVSIFSSQRLIVGPLLSFDTFVPCTMSQYLCLARLSSTASVNVAEFLTEA
jgi:hypothetical protein